MGPESAMIFFPSYITTLQEKENLVSDTPTFWSLPASPLVWLSQTSSAQSLPNETRLGPVAETPSVGSEIFPAYVTRVMPQSTNLKEKKKGETRLHQDLVLFYKKQYVKGTKWT